MGAARKTDKKKYPANAIHFPHRNGTLCGLVGRDAPTDARSYTIELADVTCPYCQEHQEAIVAYGEYVARSTAPEPASRSPRLPPLAKGQE
jgi:hypothetical protein